MSIAVSIPPITDPMGAHWDQPPRERIEIDETHAMMSEVDFKALHDYSATIPSGVYEGKMWRRCEGLAINSERRVRNLPEVPEYWVLCWFGPSKNPATCTLNSRRIVIV